MTAAPREPALRFIGRLLDRAVHDTFRHAWPLAVPFVLSDILGSWSLPLPLFVVIALAGLVENRARVVFMRSLLDADGRRLVWAAALRNPQSLWFISVVVPEGLVYVTAVVILFVPFWLATQQWLLMIDVFRFGLLFAGSAAVEILLTLLLGVLMLAAIASTAAMIDVVADGMSPWPAVVRWAQLSFRRRTIWSSLCAAGVYVALALGTGVALQATLPGPYWLHALIVGVPAGIADTIGFMFVWHWRNAVLDRELGRDLVIALDEREQRSG